MKSYIEDPYKNGIFTLPIHINSSTTDEFKNIFLNAKIIAYGFSGTSPYWRTFQTASGFLLYFDNDKIVEFNSLITGIPNTWDEYGSLRVVIHDSISSLTHADLTIEKYEIEPVDVTFIYKLFFQDKEMLIDCGIVFSNNENYEIKIAAAGASMCVTVRAPFSTGKFEPDIYEELFQRVPL